MQPEQLKAKLQEAGWSIVKDAASTRGVDWYAWIKQDGIPNCCTNEKPPIIVIYPWNLEVGGRQWDSVQFEIVGDAGNDSWYSLKAYSVPMDEAIETIPKASKILRAAWIAACEVARSEERKADGL